MFIRNTLLRKIVFVKIIVVVFVCTLIINLYLFYHLRSDSYLQGKTFTTRNSQRIPDTKSSKSNQLVYAPVKQACKVGNYSTLISDILLQLKEDLEKLYFTIPNSTDLQSRCMQFLSNVYLVHDERVILTDDLIDLANKKLITSLKESQVLKVANAPKGTQLKLLVQLSSNITAIFKPRWYSPNDVISGLVYSGKDRHYGEVVAFYLSILLNLQRVPPSVIRILDLTKEITSIADQTLLDTFVFKENETCFFGVCYYCNPLDSLCTTTGTVEGSLSYYLSSSFTFKVIQHPWRRTYRCSSMARWETDENYCTNIRNSRFYSNKRNGALFLDLMDVAIFDFLIDNGDRHRYEHTTNLKFPRILIIDNGKSFGNPYTDHIDILAPLYQCCILRESTWSNLLLLRGGELTKWLKFLMEQSDDLIQINELHLQALDRRLLIVFATAKYCFQKFGIKNVLVVE